MTGIQDRIGIPVDLIGILTGKKNSSQMRAIFNGFLTYRVDVDLALR